VSVVPESGTAWWLVTRKALPGIGGMERLSSELATRLARRHAVRTVAHAGGRIALAKFLLDAAGQVKAAASRGEMGLLHLGDSVLAPLARIARTHGVPAVVTIHGLDVTHPHPVYRAWRKRFLRDLDAYVCNSHATRDAAIAAGVPAERTHVIGIGIDPVDATHSEREDERLLFVGRLIKRKGLAWFVRDVLPGVAARRPALKLAIVGAGPERGAVERAARAGGVADRLQWFGAAGEDRARIPIGPNPQALTATIPHLFVFRQCGLCATGWPLCVILEHALIRKPETQFSGACFRPHRFRHHPRGHSHGACGREWSGRS